MSNQSSPKPLPFFYVGKNITTQRRAGYCDQKHGLLSNAIGKPDTMSIWYSKEHIETLLDEIEYAGGDGIRVYFGMYESSHEFAGQTCLLMNSTREMVIGNIVCHKDVILENEPDFADRSSMPRDMTLFGGGNILSPGTRDFNYGSPCPPRCDTDTDDGN